MEKPKVTKFDQSIIDAYEKFIVDVYEACRFVEMGGGKKYKAVFDILLPIINVHEKEMWKEIEEKLNKPL